MQSIIIVNEWEKRATEFIHGIILHLITVIQIDIISFCLGKRDSEILAAVHCSIQSPCACSSARPPHGGLVKQARPQWRESTWLGERGPLYPIMGFG